MDGDATQPAAQPGRGPRARTSTPKVLILGAGGFLGLNTVRAFLDAQLTPACGRRPRGNVLGLRGLGVPLATTDFGDPASLKAALEGVEVVVHAAAHYPRFSTEPERTLRRGVDELEAVLEALAASGVRRLVFVSSTATIAPRDDGMPSTEADVFAARPSYGTYHALKWALETRVLAERRFEVTVANPGACLGPFDWKVGTSALLLATARRAPVPHPDGLISTVDARDVGAALVHLTLTPNPPRRLILAAQTWEAHALLRALASRYGAPPPPPALAPDEARALADAQESEAARAGGRAALPRELVDLIVHAPRVDASLARFRGLGFRPLNETLDAWDAWARRMGLLPSTPSH